MVAKFRQPQSDFAESSAEVSSHQWVAGTLQGRATTAVN
jgi:hypothetical protein